MVTGYPDTEMATAFLKKGVKDYLVKPVEKEKLLTKGTLKKLSDFFLKNPQEIPELEVSDLNLDTEVGREIAMDRIERILIERKLEVTFVLLRLL